MIVHNGVLLGGLALLLVGFGFKIAAVPFHMWSPDVYEGSPSPVAGFMAAVAKAGAFAALLRVFVTSFPTVRADWQPVVWVLACLSLVLGAVVALTQRDVKRMMAYSSINHVGFILLGVEACSARGVSASLYYVFTYLFLVIGSFAVITVVAGPGDTRSSITDYRGLARRQPLLALAFAVLLLGQAGAPFTTGFLAKLGVIEASVADQGYTLAVVAMAVGRRGRLLLPSPGRDHVLAGGAGRRRARRRGLPDGRSAAGSRPLPGRSDGDQPAGIQVLTDDAPLADVEAHGPVPVPATHHAWPSARAWPSPWSSGSSPGPSWTSPTRPPCCSCADGPGPGRGRAGILTADRVRGGTVDPGGDDPEEHGMAQAPERPEGKAAHQPRQPGDRPARRVRHRPRPAGRLRRRQLQRRQGQLRLLPPLHQPDLGDPGVGLARGAGRPPDHRPRQAAQEEKQQQ